MFNILFKFRLLVDVIGRLCSVIVAITGHLLYCYRCELFLVTSLTCIAFTYRMDTGMMKPAQR